VFLYVFFIGILLVYDDDSIEDITEITPTEFIYCDVYLSNIIENKLEIFNCSFINFPHIFYSERHLLSAHIELLDF
jgi:hypothetical protein